MTDLVGSALVLLGLGFALVAAVGFVRLPDVFSRLHVTGILDTMGAPLILLGMAVHLGPTLTAGKLVLALVFLYTTSPLVGHLLSVAAMESGYEPSLATDRAHASEARDGDAPESAGRSSADAGGGEGGPSSETGEVSR